MVLQKNVVYPTFPFDFSTSAVIVLDFLGVVFVLKASDESA